MFEISKAATLPLWAVAGLSMVATVAVSAQTTPSDPADATARVPAAQYVSPLRSYQGQAPGPIASWRDTNDLVRQRGGWRAYAGEARGPEAAKPSSSASQPAPAASAAPSGHVGHGTK